MCSGCAHTQASAQWSGVVVVGGAVLRSACTNGVCVFVCVCVCVFVCLPHVTFFFNGGRETPFKGETRLLCPSPKVATYDLQPEMSAYDIRDAIVPELEKASADFICLNFANPDMVGHTGDMQAAIKACEVVDSCAQTVIEAAKKQNYSVLVIADHGNCDTMRNPDGSPNTAHTTNPVPFILVDKDIKKVSNGVLGDIAPTILALMGIPKPAVMTGKSLI